MSKVPWLHICKNTHVLSIRKRQGQQEVFGRNLMIRYCWWLKSCTTRDGSSNVINYNMNCCRVFCISNMSFYWQGWEQFVPTNQESIFSPRNSCLNGAWILGACEGNGTCFGLGDPLFSDQVYWRKTWRVTITHPEIQDGYPKLQCFKGSVYIFFPNNHFEYLIYFHFLREHSNFWT